MPSGAAAVLALLAPGSLMWGEVQALQVGAAYPTKKPLAAISVHQVVRGLWDTSLAICIHLPAAAEQAACHAAAQAAAQAAAEQAAAAAVQAAMQRGPKALSAQPSDTGLPGAVEGAIHLPLSQDSWYRSCVELIVPSLLHLRAVGDIDAEHYRSAAEDWFNMLEQLVVLRLNTEDVWELPFAGPSQNFQPLLQELPIFTNPAVCITSLEAAVRHNWDASTAPGADSTGLKLAAAILVALGHLTKEMPQSSSSSSSSSGAMLLHERRPLLQYATDTSKSPALLSLLLSCTKQLQYSCRQNPHGALRMAGLSRAVADIAMDVFQLCTEPALTISSTGPVQGTRDMAHTSSNAEAPAASSSSVSGNSTSVTKALCNSRLSPTAGQADSIHPELPAAATAPSIGQAGRPQAGEGTRTLPSTWLVLFGRALYTAGAALQAVAAGAAGTAPTTDTRSMFKVGSLHTPAPATSLLRTFQRYTSLVCVYMKADTSAIAITRKSLGKVQPAAAAVDPILQAYRTLAAALAAAAQLTEELEAAAAAATSSSTGDSLLEWLAGETGGQPEALGLIAMRQTASSSMGIWRQILGDEQGQQLPQAMMDAGSLLCATLPSRSCCNEPSCCCLDKPSELQLAGGKGTKCSGCGVARYCSTVHQKLHWKQHRPACRAIAAAETAANAST